MGRRKIQDGNDDFYDWLVANKFTSATAKNYLSGVRYIIRGAKVSNLEPEAYLKALRFHERGDYPAKRAAWLRYCEFREIEIHDPHLKEAFVGSMLVDAVTELPHDLLESLSEFLEITKKARQQIAMLTWKSVKLVGTNFDVKLDDGTYMMSQREILPFMMYSRFQPGADAPFIPASPGSSRPYPLALLHEALRNYKLAKMSGKIAVPELPPVMEPRVQPVKPRLEYVRKPKDARGWELNKLVTASMMEGGDYKQWFTGASDEMWTKVDAEIAKFEEAQKQNPLHQAMLHRRKLSEDAMRDVEAANRANHRLLHGDEDDNTDESA